MRITRAGVVTAAFLGVFAVVRPGASVSSPAVMSALPPAAGGLRASEATLAAAGAAQSIGADEYVYRIYRGGASPVEMDVAYYRDPRVGRVMHSPLNCLPGNGWRIGGMRTLPVSGEHTVRTLTAERGDVHLALMYWYQTASRVTGSEMRSRANLLVDAFTLGRRDAALVRLVMPLTGTPDQGTHALTGIASELIPQIAARFQ